MYAHIFLVSCELIVVTVVETVVITSTVTPGQGASINSVPEPTPSPSPGPQPPMNVCDAVEVDFTKGQKLPSAFKIDYCPQNVVYAENSLQLVLSPQCGTTVSYKFPRKFGKISARMRFAPGSGAVSALIFAGPDPADEIDIEFVGKDSATIQSMYFVKGQRIDQLAQFHTPAAAQQQQQQADLSLAFHDYAIELLPDRINWLVDGSVVRTLTKDPADTANAKFPIDAASFVRFGVWDGSSVSSWAGVADYSSGNKIAYIQNLKFTPYC
ncbi:putative glycosidase crf1 [Smittium culicis]|uniref:Putative glycosidase crf1 n=1 Tax=Smittium culicis TaxID=133412 RepID=A0A1R1Y3A1_9FUNG|nr:putative glycosidase crf1 [Smittium culicis]OMJ27013.1 putative glycosidase crf1 [Smittium culicis]